LKVLGYDDQAEYVMSKFKWGNNSFVINQKVFDMYHGCKTTK
jgi:ribosome biogenesis protein Tsr3